MMMFGWTPIQWSIALARTSIVVSNLSSYLDVKMDWACNYNYEPGEIKIAGVEVEVDNVATHKLHKMWVANKNIILLLLTEVKRSIKPNIEHNYRYVYTYRTDKYQYQEFIEFEDKRRKNRITNFCDIAAKKAFERKYPGHDIKIVKA